MNELKELHEKLERYKRVTEQALKEVKIIAENPAKSELAEKFLSMAKDYFEDGKYFEKKGHSATALAAFAYAHAWIDAGIKAGFLKGENEEIFMPK